MHRKNLKKLIRSGWIDIFCEVSKGVPLYAECGGKMYTLKNIDDCSMLGIFDGKARFLM